MSVQQNLIAKVLMMLDFIRQASHIPLHEVTGPVNLSAFVET